MRTLISVVAVLVIPVTAEAADIEAGKAKVQTVCAACHGTGITGAPKLGDKAAWGPRLAQGPGTLDKHAIEGFQGKAGYMPPKGGRTDLSDQSVVNAVEHMVAAAK